MAKIHLDRLKSRYGFKGKKYSSLVNRILENNIGNMERNIARANNSIWEKGLKKISTKEKQFIVPDLSDVLPKRSVYVLKAAQRGKLIKDTLRDRLTKNLKDALAEFTPSTGESTYIRRRGAKAGLINEKLINQFENSIKNTFENYTKIDKKYKMPANVHTIAVTEARNAISNIKNSYVSKMLEKNPGLQIQKQWIQNKGLSKEPRPGHDAVHLKKIDYNEKFAVPIYIKKNNKWIKTNGIVYMSHPHDPNAPADQVIGCNCDYRLFARSKNE